MPNLTKPVRRGRSKNLTLDHDALPLLLALCPHTKAQGRFISELIRTEVRVREEREKVKAALLAALAPEDALVESAS